MTCKRIDITPDIQVWSCRISEDTFEIYGLVPSPEEMHQEFQQYEVECDLHREQDLADQFIEGLDSCPDWPFYADSPCEVEEPQVFSP